ncbi:hypothetical protein ACFE04_001284 [Oxalis oulophora]
MSPTLYYSMATTVPRAFPSSFHNNKKQFTQLTTTHFSSNPLLKLTNTNTSSISISIKHQTPFCRIGCLSTAVESLQLDNNNNIESTTNEEEEEEGRLYVGNLPFSVDNAQLTEVFSQAGTVVNVEIVYDKRTAVERSRGFGFVTMETVQQANEAIRLFDGTEIGGRNVKVNFPQVPRGGERTMMGARIRSTNLEFVDSPNKLYAGNLNWTLTSEGLKQAFADQPGVLSAKVIHDRISGRPRGFGFVSFETTENLEHALNTMNGVEVEGRALRLNRATERAPVTPTVQDSGSEINLDSSEIPSDISP